MFLCVFVPSLPPPLPPPLSHWVFVSFFFRSCTTITAHHHHRSTWAGYAPAYGPMVGGAMLMQTKHYAEINGFSNQYFGI
jgi:hypothetical protein